MSTKGTVAPTLFLTFLLLDSLTVPQASIAMVTSTFSFFVLFIPSLVFALNSLVENERDTSRHLPPSPLRRRGPANGYYDPQANGGSMLTQVNGTFPPGQGEPINVILSAVSDSAVLQDTQLNGGLRNYYLSFGFSSECLGQHSGSDQLANLGDGNGYKIETAVIRWDYGNPALGSCEESIQGGNHFRYWVQNGPIANSGAVFMALSYEKPIAQQHDIIPNGYNLGRDWLVGNATAQPTDIYSLNLTNTSTLSGQTSYGGYTYRTQVQYVSNLLPNTSIGINHNQSVPVPGANAVDGLVAVLGVTIVQRPSPSNTPSSSAIWTASSPMTWHLPAVVALSLLNFAF